MNRWRVPLLWIALVGLLGWSAVGIPVDADRLAKGIGRAGEFLAGFARPDFITRGREIGEGLRESLAMALAATVFGGVLSLPTGLLAARNFAPGWLHGTVRFGLVAARSFPELLIAIYCVAVFGFGPFAGWVTLVIATVGFLGKLLADEIEAMDPEPLAALTAVGGTWAQRVRFGVLPALMPRMTGLLLYRFDINFRESAIIGIVGAGGIGATLQTAIDRYEFTSAAAILLCIIGLVLGIEYFSGNVRQRLVTGRGASPAGDAPSWAPAAWPQWLRPAGWIGLAGLLGLAIWQIAHATDWEYLGDAPEVLGDLARRSWPPAPLDWAVLGPPLLDTIRIASLGTALAVGIGVPLAFLAARNTTPHPVIRGLAITLAVGSRTVNSLIWALLLVKLIGPGVLAGVIAIGIRSIGFITKLFYEAVEEIRREPVEAVKASGAAGTAVFRHAVAPQVMPACVGISLYRWDINIRESAVVGLVGAGGIGLLLDAAVNRLLWREAMTILVAVFVLVWLAEWLSNRLRRAVI